MLLRSFRGSILYCILALLSFSSAWAETDFSKGLLKMQDLITTASRLTVETCPNADEVLVDDYIHDEYNPDGTGISWDDTLVKVLTEKGKRERQSLSFHFNQHYSATTITLLQIIKPDGKTQNIDAAALSRVMVDSGQMDANIYDPNQKILQVGLPGLEVGDMLRYVSCERTLKTRVPNTWSSYQTFESTSPLKHLIYEVSAPKALPLRNIALKSPVPDTVKFTQTDAENDRILYRWEVTNVPRMFEEPSMPEAYTVVQRLLLSTTADWKTLSKWYCNLSEPHLKATPAMQAKVTELTSGLKSDEEKVQAIFRFVSQQIRYMGITTEAEAPGYEPHDASMTFENRHGVCRDKAALLVTLLRTAGLKSWPVLIMAGPKKDEEVPTPYFNHAIVAWENKPGEYVLMDPTNENTKDIFPTYLCNRSYLVAKPEGETLRVSSIVPAEKNLVKIESKGKLDASGNLSCATTIAFDGINDTMYRGAFVQKKPEELKRYFEGLVKKIVPGATLTSLEITPAKLQDTSQSLCAKLTFDAKDILVHGNDLTMLMPPRFGSAVGIATQVIGETGLEKRKYVMETEVTCGVRENLRLELDPAIGKVESLPEYAPISDDVMSVKRAVQLQENGRVLTLDSDFLFKVVEVNPTQYLTLKERLKEMEFDGRKRVIFRGGTSGIAPDARVLSQEFVCEVQDAHNYVVTESTRYQVLSYKGKKEYSELKFEYNSAWESVELESATVRTGEKTKSISKQELNLMDADWVGSAPRYPAGKILVASLPGVEIGSIIEVRHKTTLKNRPFIANQNSFRSTHPIDSQRVRLIVPKALPFKITRTGGLEKKGLEGITETSTTSGTAKVLEWTAHNVQPIKPEDQTPPLWSFVPTYTVSAGNWPDYAVQVSAALQKASHGQSATKKATKEVIKGAKTDVQRVRAIRDFVAENIRPAGPSLNDLPLTAISPADKTLEDGYGNSADRAVLLGAMLNYAGFDFHFTLASNSPLDSAKPSENLARLTREVPMASSFPEVLVALELNNKMLYLNDTNQYDALGATSHDNRVGLMLSGASRVGRAFGNKACQLMQIKAEPELRDRREGTYRVELDAQGNALITMTRLFYGNAFGDKKKFYDELPSEKRRRYFLEVVAEISQGAVMQGEPTTNFETYPGLESITVKADKYAVRENDRLYLTLPGWRDNTLGVRSDQRTNPLYWSVPTRQTIKTDIVLPEEFRKVILVPENLEWNAPNNAGHIRREQRLKQEKGNSTLSFVYEVDTLPAVFAPTYYGELLEINRRLSHPAARTVMLGRN